MRDNEKADAKDVQGAGKEDEKDVRGIEAEDAKNVHGTREVSVKA